MGLSESASLQIRPSGTHSPAELAFQTVIRGMAMASRRISRATGLLLGCRQEHMSTLKQTLNRSAARSRPCRGVLTVRPGTASGARTATAPIRRDPRRHIPPYGTRHSPRKEPRKNMAWPAAPDQVTNNSEPRARKDNRVALLRKAAEVRPRLGGDKQFVARNGRSPQIPTEQT